METIKRIRSESEYDYEASCRGKIGHTNFQEARKAKAKMERKTGKKMKIYRCRFCELLKVGSVKDYKSEDVMKWGRYVKK